MAIISMLVLTVQCLILKVRGTRFLKPFNAHRFGILSEKIQ